MESDGLWAMQNCLLISDSGSCFRNRWGEWVNISQNLWHLFDEQWEYGLTLDQVLSVHNRLPQPWFAAERHPDRLLIATSYSDLKVLVDENQQVVLKGKHDQLHALAESILKMNKVDQLPNPIQLVWDHLVCNKQVQSMFQLHTRITL